MLKYNEEENVDNVADSCEKTPGKCFFAMIRILAAVFLLLGLAGVGVGILFAVKEHAGIFGLTAFAIPSLLLISIAIVIIAIGKLAGTRQTIEQNQDNYKMPSDQNITPIINEANENGSSENREIISQLEQVAKILSEIQENTLLDDAGRKRKYEFIVQQERNRVYAEINALAAKQEWARARSELNHLIEKYPDVPEVAQHLIELEEKRKASFPDELATATKRVNDLFAISAWDKAINVAEMFVVKHPDMTEAKELASFVHEERTKFRNEQIKRMYADIQKSTARKRWNDALDVSRQLIGKYPESMEAEALRVQIETMESNAEIERRQQLEEQIKDLVKRHNFIQAVELARYVIEQFPNSPQALALRGQLPKLEKLSKEQEKEIDL